MRGKVRDQSYIKQYNIQTVLAMLKQYQPISRTDISKITGMSPTSITRIVTALLNQDLVYEAAGDQRSGRGRKATYLRMNADGLYSIGIHLERSMIRLCALNMADEILYRGEMLVDGVCTPEKMACEAKHLLERIPEDVISDRGLIGSVGVCLSGVVDKWRGIVVKSCQMGWENVDLRAVFSEAFGLPVCVENDVKACLIGEKVRMNIPDQADTVYMLVDSGIGLAATSSGNLVRGEKNEAGEIAGMPVGKKPDGTVDHLANHLSEGALLSRARRYDSSICTLDALPVAQEKGAEWADALIADFREYLQSAVQMINCIYNPAKIIIGGSVSHRLYPTIAEEMAVPNLCLGMNYEDSCMTGAGLIAMRHAIVERIGQNIE